MTSVARDLLWSTIQSVRIVLADAREFGEGFADDYPPRAQRLAEQYCDAGTVVVEGARRFLGFVETNGPSSGADASLGLPCFR